MLSGIKLVGKDEVERLVKDEKKHKKHEQRKKKKEKRKHKKQHHRSDSSDGGHSSSFEDEGAHPRRGHHKRSDSDHSSGPDDAWQRDLNETAQPAAGGGIADDGNSNGDQARAQREDWMTVPMARPFEGNISNKEQQEKEERARKEAEDKDPDKIKISDRELNPYLRAAAAGATLDEQQQPTAVPSVVGVGDGGASWRLKALKRAKEQASEQGLALNEVVSERWGSLAQLTSSLTENRAAHGMAHAHAARDRRHHNNPTTNDSNTRDDKDTRRHGHRPPRDLYRKQDGDRSTFYKDRHSDDRELSAASGAAADDNNNNRSGGSGDSSRYLKDVRSEKSQMRRPQQPESLSWRRRDKQQQPASDSDAHTRSRGDEGRRSAAHRPARDRDNTTRTSSREDSVLLQSVAKELNTFHNDGSFLDQFGNKAEEKQIEEPQQQQHQQQQKEQDDDILDDRDVVEANEAAARPGHSSITRPAATSTVHQKLPHSSAASGRGGGNLSAAALLKARLLGKAPPPPPPQAEEETVVLPLVDHAGRAVPGAFGREAAGTAEAAFKPGKKVERYEGGEKRRYFADDDAMDLATLVKRTKYEGAGHIDRSLAQGIARKSRFKEGDLDADAEYDHDAGIDLLDKKVKKKAGTAQAAEREKQRQIRDYNKYNNALDRCSLCFTSKARPRHLTLAIGQCTYLALPPRGRLVPGHCQIIPAEHIASTRISDETVWTEIRNFKKCLIQMFMKQGKECIFFETAMGLNDMRSHAVIDCVPIPAGAAAKAPMYFKNAIDDATSEWSQHHAKRSIDTKAKGLKGSIPPNFPYLNVEFGISDGFVHVIDNESKFDKALARSVVIGLLKLPAEDMHRQAKRESEAIQVKWVEEFREEFAEFDWTKML